MDIMEKLKAITRIEMKLFYKPWFGEASGTAELIPGVAMLGKI